MNFTQEIKRELIKRVPRTERERALLLGGVLIASGKVSREELVFTSESESTAKYLLTLAEGVPGVQMFLTSAAYDPKHGRDKLTFSLSGKFPESLFFPAEGDEDGACAFVKGGFLGGGSCTLPRAGTKTGYHLEFGFPSRERAERFLGVLEELEFIPNLVSRGEHSVIYIKSREAISDFLSVVGANGALNTLDEISAEREANNTENRVNNCLGSNADRAAIASVEQVKAITGLKERGKLALLSEELQSTAAARLENPELSLSELAAHMGISKSCLSHRLRKLTEIGNKE